MRLNLLPLVFTPGVGGIGYLVGGGQGSLVALAGWAALVSLATALVLTREARRRRAQSAR